MRVKITRLSTIIVASLLVLAVASTVCNAQEFSREGQTEFFGTFQTMNGGEATSTGAKVDFDDTTVYGIGMGTNITNNWNVNMDLLFGSTDLTPSGPGSGATAGDTNLWLLNVNVDYNILPDSLTPLVTAGIGLFGANGDFNNGASFTESNFSYNFGIGGRWDVSDSLFLKVVYRLTYTDFEGMDGPDFDGVNLTLGFKW